MLVLLPDSGTELLRRELAFAFEELGHDVRRVHPARLLDERSADYLPSLLESGAGLFFSVNMQGLLPGGQVPEMLLRAGVPVLSWFVDNPWHVLSGMRDPSWKNFHLAVTDHTFIEPLAEASARLRSLQAERDSAGEPASSCMPKVLHMPLAVCPRCLGQSRARADSGSGKFSGLGQVIFAGRSSFPSKDDFFAGQQVDPDLLREAEALCRDGVRPDFAWWLAKIAQPEKRRELWPGKRSRGPGLGAAESNRLWRGQRLAAAMRCGLTIFGDQGWSSLGAELDLRPPFDYYARIHGISSQAAFSLNLNSLLMNAGLTQRIFDVWPAGGFCLTDNSPGLGIFPSELAGPVTFNRPEEVPELVDWFTANPKQKTDLSRAWREYILLEHSYTARLDAVLPKVV